MPDLEGVRRGLLKLFNQDTNTVIETDSAFGITSHSSPERIQEFIQKTGDKSPQQIGDMLVFAKDGSDVVVDEFMEEVRNKVVSTGISESLADLPDYNGLEGIKALDPDREAMFSEGIIRDGKYYGPGSSVVPGVDNQDEIFTIVGKGPNGELLVATSDASPEALASLQEQGVELWSAAANTAEGGANRIPGLNRLTLEGRENLHFRLTGNSTPSLEDYMSGNFEPNSAWGGGYKFVRQILNNNNINFGHDQLEGSIAELYESGGLKAMLDGQWVTVTEANARFLPEGAEILIDPKIGEFLESRGVAGAKDALSKALSSMNPTNPNPLQNLQNNISENWKGLAGLTVAGAGTGAAVSYGLEQTKDEADRDNPGALWKGAALGAVVAPLAGGALAGIPSAIAGIVGGGAGGAATHAGRLFNQPQDTHQAQGNNRNQPQQPQQNNTPPQAPQAPQAPNLPPQINFSLDIPQEIRGMHYIPAELPNRIANAKTYINEINGLVLRNQTNGYTPNDVGPALNNALTLIDELKTNPSTIPFADPQNPTQQELNDQNAISKLEAKIMLQLAHSIMPLFTQYIKYHEDNTLTDWNSLSMVEKRRVVSAIQSGYEDILSVVNTLFSRRNGDTSNFTGQVTLNPPMSDYLHNGTQPIILGDLVTNFNSMMDAVRSFDQTALNENIVKTSILV